MPGASPLKLKRAQALLAAGELAAARDLAAPILARFPANEQARRVVAASWHREGVAALQAGRLDGALDALARAASADPRDARVQNDLGACRQLRGELDEAIACFERACALADDPDALENLASALHRRGRGEASRRAFERLAAHPRARDPDRWRVRAALQVPAIAGSEAGIEAVRAELARELDALLARPPRIEAPEARYVPPMFLSYHGRSNRDLLGKLARVFRAATPALGWTAPHCRSYRGSEGRRLRVGFVSSFLYNHSIGHTTRGFLEQLDRERFEAIAIRIPPFRQDAIAGIIDRASDRVVHLPESLAAMRAAIGGLELDVLFYQDIGMEPMSYFLAFARLAPVQCVSFGHPDTTGIDTMDWFVSGDLVEPEDDPQADYSERLHRLRGVGTLSWYVPPEPPPSITPRARFGLAGEHHVYLCPQALFKVHPRMDSLFLRILEGDPRGRIVLIAAGEPWWTEALRTRLGQSLGELARRVVFVPRLPHADYLSLLAGADVGLDTLFFNGMNTSLESFAMGLPVVTLPGRLQRSRHTAGMYRRMGLEGFVAGSEDEYVALALRACADPAFNREWRAAIAARRADLYRDASVVRQFEAFFETAVADARQRNC